MRWNVTRPSLTAATMPARPGSVSTMPTADLASHDLSATRWDSANTDFPTYDRQRDVALQINTRRDDRCGHSRRFARGTAISAVHPTPGISLRRTNRRCEQSSALLQWARSLLPIAF